MFALPLSTYPRSDAQTTGGSSFTSNMAGREDDPGSETPGEELRNWSSLIGIVTAIVGNVLIALALNVQRYAHIRLHRERTRIKGRAKAAERRAELALPAYGGSYGTTDSNRAEAEPSRMNGSSGSGSGSGTLVFGGERGCDESGLPAPHLNHRESSITACEYGDTDEEGEEGQDLSSSYLKSPYWWLGQVLITLGEMGNFLAYGFAPASIVSPLGVVALISNCIIAPFLFHEKFRQRDLWGLVIAVAGVVTVVLSANQEETKLDPHAVWDAITTLEFEIYLAVSLSLIAVLTWFSSTYGSRTILIDLGLVGLFGGYTALATKGVSSMISSTLLGAFTTPVTYVLVLILLVTAIMQIRYLNRALQRFDSTEVIPIQFVMFTLCVIIGSAILYRDFERTTATQAVKFVGGCLLTFFGVFLITSGRPPKDDEDTLSDVDGVEETIGLLAHDSLARGLAGGLPETPVGTSASHRSSRSSRASLAEALMKPFSVQRDGGIPSLRTPTATATGPGARAFPPEEGGPVVSGLRRGFSEDVLPSRKRTMSSDTIRSVSGASTMSTDDVLAATEPSTPLGVRSGGAPPQYPTATPDFTNAADATDPQTPSRPPLAKHHGRHFNGPIISPSPLSSTVSAVVKDSLRRHGDKNSLMRKSSLGRIRSSIRASLFISDEDDQTSEEGSPRPPLFGDLAGVDEAVAAAHAGEEAAAAFKDGRTRPRSLSDALGEFFRLKKKPRETDDPDVEDDGSGDEYTDDDR